MQTFHLWEKFETSGKVEDYLSYKEQVNKLSAGHDKLQVTSGDEGQYAGIYTGDRDDFSTISRGRIR